MKKEIIRLHKFFASRRMKKYAKMIEDMSFGEEKRLLDNVPDDIIAFTIAFLEVCEDSLGYLKTLHSDLSDSEESSGDLESSADDEEISLEEGLSVDKTPKSLKDKIPKELADKREESASERKKIILDAEKARKTNTETVDLFDITKNTLITEDIEMVHDFMLQENPRAMFWYDDFRKYMLHNVFGGDDDTMLAKTFYRILAATSVQRNPKINFDLTQKIMENVPEDFDPGRFFVGEKPQSSLVKKDEGNFLNSIGLVPAHKTGILHALMGIEIAGPKVSRFSLNLQGDLQPVTMDVHMFDFLFSNKDDMIFDERIGRMKKVKKTNLSERRRMSGEDIFQSMAHKISLSPAQLQASIWMFRTTFEKGVYSSYDYMTEISERVPKLKEQLSVLETYLKVRGLT